jgi:AcrR family transcriptional regulator
MPTRAYTQTKRADATEQTRRAILDGAQHLFREERELDFSLEQVAARAGCSTRSIIRHFGSRQGLIEAAVADAAAAVAEERRVKPGDVEGGIRALVDHYELLGDEVIRWLGSAERYPLVRRVVETGTRMHLEWVDEVFGPDLERLPAAGRGSRRAVLASITDVRFWNLLRRREGLGRDASERAILDLVR